jgi:hypothetical protein
VDSNSNPLETRTYGGTNTDDAYSITQTQDDGFAVTGVSGVTGKRRICVIKTDSSLDTVWSKHFDAGFIAEGWEILETPDCGLVVAGWGDDGAHLMQLSPDGDSIWAQTYVEARYAHSLIQNDDGTYVVTGAMLMSKSPEKFNYKPYLVKTDQNGSTLWTRSLELCSWCYPSSVQRTFDSGYALAGSRFVGSANVFLAKTDSLGWINPIELIPAHSEQNSYDADTTWHSVIIMSNNTDPCTVYVSLVDVNTISGWSATFPSLDTFLILDPLGGRDTVTITITPPLYSKSDTMKYAVDTCYLIASCAGDTTVSTIITHAYHIGVEEINEQLSIRNYQLTVHPNPFVHSAEVGAQGIVPFAKGSVETPYMVSLQVHDLSN